MDDLKNESVEKGICRLSVIPMRKAPSESSEMVNQLLFGEHYSVYEITADRSWLKIKCYYDDYEGWISGNQHYAISDEYFEQINNSDYKICLDLTSNILFKKHLINILIGSILPISTNELFKIEEQLAFNGEAKSQSQRRDYEFLKETALKYLNAPYLWGGRSPFGIDCSGLTQMIFKINGYKLKRDSSEQRLQGHKIDGMAKIIPGDLAFLENVKSKVFHVGMIMENNEIIHASGRVRIDKLNEEGIINKENGKLSHRLIELRRIIKD